MFFLLPFPKAHCARVLGVALLAATGACTTDTPDTPAPAADAKTSLMAAHPWRIVAFTTTDSGVQPPTTVNTFLTFSAHRLDDTYQFKATQDLVFDDGRQKGVASDPQTTNGQWLFRNDQTLLDITLNRGVALGTFGSSSTSTYRILELTDNTLRLEQLTTSQVVVITLAK